MYKRKEVIVEEHLDWDDHSKDKIQEKNLKVTLPHDAKHKQLLTHKESGFQNKPEIKHKVTNYIDENEPLWLLGLGILIVPYLLGLLINIVLFYIYSGISLGEVFSIEKQYKIWELWSIGAYTFVTLGIILILLQMFKEGR